MFNKEKFGNFIAILEEDNMILYFFYNILGLDNLVCNDYAYRLFDNGFDLFWNMKYYRYIFINKDNDCDIIVEDNNEYIVYYIYTIKCNNNNYKNSNITIFGSIFTDINNYKYLNKKIHSYITKYLS